MPSSLPNQKNNKGTASMLSVTNSNIEETSPVLFRETQRFRQVCLWLLLLLIAASIWVGFIAQIVLRKPLGSRPSPDVLIVIFWTFFGLFFPLFFRSLNLPTEVRVDGLHYRFFPNHRTFQKIHFEEIKQYYVRTYSAFKDYVGYGVRYKKKGKAYNVSGNKGILLELIDGKRILFGSHRPEEFMHALDKATGKI